MVVKQPVPGTKTSFFTLHHASHAANSYTSLPHFFDADLVQEFRLLYTIADFLYAVPGEPSFLLKVALYQRLLSCDF